MRIGFDAQSAFTNISGLGNYSRSMIEILSKYCGLGNKYFLFSSFDTNSAGFVIPEGVEVVTPSTIVGDVSPFLWRNFGMAHDLRHKKIDVYHGMSNALPYDIRFGGAKSIVTIHDLAFLRYPNLYSQIDRYILNKKYRFACKFSDLIIATSEQTKRDIIEYFDISKEKIEVVRQTCHSSFLKKSTQEKKNEVRKKYNLPQKYILSVGTLEERKNLILTLYAIASGRLDVHLVACGRETPYVEQLIDFVKKEKIEDKVHFIQNIHFDDLPTVYQCAEGLVYMSLVEGFGIPIVEAFNSQIPVITSSDAVFKETGGDACVYIGQHDLEDMIEAIDNISKNETMRNEIIEKGLERAKIYKEDVIAKKLFSVYDKLM